MLSAFPNDHTPCQAIFLRLLCPFCALTFFLHIPLSSSTPLLRICPVVTLSVFLFFVPLFLFLITPCVSNPAVWSKQKRSCPCDSLSLSLSYTHTHTHTHTRLYTCTDSLLHVDVKFLSIEHKKKKHEALNILACSQSGIGISIN